MTMTMEKKSFLFSLSNFFLYSFQHPFSKVPKAQVNRGAEISLPQHDQQMKILTEQGMDFLNTH